MYVETIMNLRIVIPTVLLAAIIALAIGYVVHQDKYGFCATFVYVWLTDPSCGRADAITWGIGGGVLGAAVGYLLSQISTPRQS